MDDLEREPVRQIRRHPVMEGNIFTVRYVPAHHVFLALGYASDHVYYRSSADLLNWSAPKTLLQAPVFNQWNPGQPGPQWYYSLLDPSSASRDFDTLEQRPYLYYVKFRVKGGKFVNGQRDLMRVPLHIEW
jgi:hypothetical protein